MTEVVTCPSCGSQYLATAVSCVDCGAPLVAGPRLEPADDEVGYELGDWGDGERHDLARQIADLGIASRWEGVELVVREADADAVEELIDEIDNPDALAAEEDDADAGAELLSTLYVSSDVLQHDGTSAAAVVELLEAAEQAAELGPPYGIDGEVWRVLLEKVGTVAELLGAEAAEEEVMAAARDLREAVRPLV